ncbi:MAG: hypothetical protein ABMA26_13220 [Limisphaerales bacterium]
MESLHHPAINDKLPSAWETSFIFALLFMVLALAGAVVILVCEWLARLAVPLPIGATPELQQSVVAQRESVAMLIFGLLWALIIGWAVFFR